MTIKDAFLFINQRIKEAEAVIEVDILCIDYSGVKAERLNAPCGEFNERNITIMELLILLVDYLNAELVFSEKGISVVLK